MTAAALLALAERPTRPERTPPGPTAPEPCEDDAPDWPTMGIDLETGRVWLFTPEGEP